MSTVAKLRPEEPATEPTGPKVYAAIAAVMAEIAKEGIAKDRANTQQNYKFRGIDDVYNALAPVLSRHGLLMLPNVLSRAVSERTTVKEWNGQRKDSTLFYVAVEVEFTLVAASDGSTHVIKTFGEAMDSGDKATNKAMSAAYKYAAMQAFCIPTEGDNDADATTHVIEPAPRQPTQRKPPAETNKPTLKERADKLERALATADAAPVVRKTWDLASGLCAKLDTADPERLAELTALYERRLDDLEGPPPDGERQAELEAVNARIAEIDAMEAEADG